MLGSKSIRFTLPSLPISANRSHVIDFRRRRVILSDDARKWKSDMMLLMPRFSISEGSFLHVDFVAHYRFYHRNGKLRRVDTSNLQELLHNTIAARIGIDDCYIKSASFTSVDNQDEKIEVTISEICAVIEGGDEPDGEQPQRNA